MIGSLRGRVIELHPSYLLLEIAGVGYRVRTTPGVIGELETNDEAFLYIHEQIREDAHELYGFLKSDDIDLFRSLLDVSGVGPKVALVLLSLGSAASVRDAILRGDLDYLTGAPGVGKKLAQKIILELKGQLVDDAAERPGDKDVRDALIGLGYSSAQANEALNLVPEEITDTSERIREALKRLSK